MTPLTIDSSRFGRVEIAPETVIEFPEGLIGLGGSRYALLSRDHESAFAWLQSLEDPAVALPVTNPHRFFAGYEVALTEEDAERLAVTSDAPADVYVTVCAGAALEDFTANQRAPILVWGGVGYQIINQAPDLDIRAPLFAGVEVESAAADSAC